jgi:D-arabinose 1-dehydrogenase-like Zn-dependent alcohol dehydrogenase
MKAYRIQKFGEPLTNETLADPVPKGKEVLVSVRACGLCHSDLHFHEGHINLGGGAQIPLTALGADLPMTLGHEIFGYITDFGPDAELAEADRGRPIIVYPWIGCGNCSACREGADNACARPENLGFQRPGGYGDKVVVRDQKYLVDARDINPDIAGIYACSGLTSYSALKKLPNRAGWTAIVGLGGVGLMALAVAKGIGFENVLALDIDETRLELARSEYGADLAMNSTDPELAEKAAKNTGGLDGVADFVGSEQTATLAAGLLANRGTYIDVGLFGGELRISLALMAERQLTYRGSYAGTLDELRELLHYVRAGKIRPIPITTAPFDEINDGLVALRASRIQGRRVYLHQNPPDI